VTRFLTVALAFVLLGAAGFVAVNASDAHSSGLARGATTTTATTTAAPTPTAVPPAAPASTTTDSTDWVLIAIEGLIVIGFIAIGVRAGGLGLGLWGGVGTLVLVFGFGLEPGEPPFDAMLIIIAVISAAAAMQAAGGIDYMVQVASKRSGQSRRRSISSRRTSRTCSASSPGRATRSSRSSR
jgi:hypothetical protein